MKNLENLTQEQLEQIKMRINELQTQLAKQTATAEKAQADFISGTTKIEDSLVEGQKKLMLEQALTSLELSKDALENQLKQAIVTEEVAAERQAAAKRATRRSELKAEFNQKFLAAGDRLEQSLAELLALKTEYNGLRNQDGQTSRGGSIVGIPEIEFGIIHSLGAELFLAFGSHAHKANRLQEKERVAARAEQRRERETRAPKRAAFGLG